jgi:hypothetical protein
VEAEIMDSDEKRDIIVPPAGFSSRTLRITLIALAFLLFALLVIFLAVRRQVILRGTIIDAATKQPVPGATISIENRQVTTDETGHFSISVRHIPQNISWRRIRSFLETPIYW